MSLRLQRVDDQATDQNFRTLAKHVADAPNVLELVEQETPDPPAKNRVLIYARDNGGKTVLCALFHTGVEQVLATEP